MARPKNDPVEVALDCFFGLTAEQQIEFERDKRRLEVRLQKILNRAQPEATFIQAEPRQKRPYHRRKPVGTLPPESAA